jgi:hypothetical protein
VGSMAHTRVCAGGDKTDGFQGERERTSVLAWRDGEVSDLGRRKRIKNRMRERELRSLHGAQRNDFGGGPTVHKREESAGHVCMEREG